MSKSPSSNHTPDKIASWKYLKHGQVYRLKIKAREVVNGAEKVSQGVIIFTRGAYQKAFDAAEGMEKAVKGVHLEMTRGSKSYIHVQPGSLRATHLTLTLLAGNGVGVDMAFETRVGETESSKILLSLSFAQRE